MADMSADDFGGAPVQAPAPQVSSSTNMSADDFSRGAQQVAATTKGGAAPQAQTKNELPSFLDLMTGMHPIGAAMAHGVAQNVLGAGEAVSTALSPRFPGLGMYDISGPFKSASAAENQAYQESVARTKGLQKHPNMVGPLSAGAEFAGSMAGPAVAGKTNEARGLFNAARRGFGLGATYAGMQPVGESTPAEYATKKSEQIGEGGLFGGITGGILGGPPKAVTATGRAMSYLAPKLEKAGVTPESIEEASQQATNRGKDITAAEAAGKTGQLELEGTVRRPGTTADISSPQMYERAQSRPDRLYKDISDTIGVSPQAARGNMDEIVANGRAAAKPYYEDAFSGGSTAPLQTQYENAFNKASQEHNAAIQAVNDAQRNVTMTRSMHMPTDNVYGTNSANQANRAAQVKLNQAQAAEKQAAATKQMVLDKLQQSQSDATDVNGATWTPRIQQFINSPDVRKGIARGMQIQAREALAEGRTFDPTEYAITGTDNEGLPIVGKVPNLRLLDAGKRGLDAMLEDFRDPNTRKMNWNEDSRSIEKVRKAYVDAVDDAAPDSYKQARSISGDYLSANEAFDYADRLFNDKTTEQQFDSFLNKMTDAQREANKAGVANKIFDMVQSDKYSGNAILNKFNSRRVQAKLASAIGPNQAEELTTRIRQEAQMKSAEGRFNPDVNSGTAKWSAVQKEQDQFGGPPVNYDQIGRAAYYASNPRMGMVRASGWGAQKLHEAMTGLKQEERNELGNLLLGSPEDLAAKMREVKATPPHRLTPLGQAVRTAGPMLAGSLATSSPYPGYTKTGNNQ